MSRNYEIMVPGRAYAPGSHSARNYKTAIRSAASSRIRRPLRGPLFIKIIYCYSATKFRLDGDNLLKIICDALKGIAYDDDSQIDSHHVDRLDTSSRISNLITDPPPILFDYIAQQGDFVLIQLGPKA